MKCLQTRKTAEGWRRRRYESASGVRSTTIEVPIEIWRRVNSVGRQRDRAAEAMRAIDRQSLKRQVLSLIAMGRPTREVAVALGASLRTVQRWAKQA